MEKMIQTTPETETEKLCSLTGDRTLSYGRKAGIPGISKKGPIEPGIPYLDQSEAELLSDLRALDEVLKRSRSNT